MIKSASIQFLDVRDLEPPEPLTAILATLEQMPAKQALKVRHRREPVPIYSMLDEMGYDHRCWMNAVDEYSIYIWQSAQKDLALLCDADIASEQDV